MKHRTKVNGVIIEGSDGNMETDDIVDISDSDELSEESNHKRLQFLKKHAASFGYRIVDKHGNEV